VTLVSCEIGRQGFVTYVHRLRRLGVLSQPDVLGWLRLHGSLLRLMEEPLDDGSGIDEETFVGLLRDLGAAEDMP
jgi:hypothetical protein